MTECWVLDDDDACYKIKKGRKRLVFAIRKLISSNVVNKMNFLNRWKAK